MEKISLQQKQSNQLIFIGIILFLLGLIIGLIVPLTANPRMALSSHIEGVLNGMFLIILGLIWNRLELSIRWLKFTFILSIYGTFANWLGLLIAALFNAGKDLTVAAQGKEGNPIIEVLVSFLLITLALAMIFVCVILLFGLHRRTKKNNMSK